MVVRKKKSKRKFVIFRHVNNQAHSHSRILDLCINDIFHKITCSDLINNNNDGMDLFLRNPKNLITSSWKLLTHQQQSSKHILFFHGYNQSSGCFYFILIVLYLFILIIFSAVW